MAPFGPYALLLAVAAVAFGGSLRSSFHFDDYSLFSSPLLRWDWLQPRPLTNLTYWLNYRLGGKDPFGYHLVNLLLHAAVVLLLYYTLKRLIDPNAAMIAAAIFAVHPIQSEPVAYVFARGTLLCTLLSLICWNEWLRGKRWSSVVWFGIALLAKEDCVTFPALILLALLSLKQLQRADWRPLQVMFGLSIVAGIRAALATKEIAGSGAGFTAGIGPFSYFGMQGWAILRYLRLLIVPWGFTIDPDIRVNLTWVYAAAWLAIVVLIAVALLRFKELKEGFWGIAGLVLLIPSSTIFPAADLAADRRMYLPMVAFVGIFGMVARKWHAWVPGAIVFALAALSVLRMEVWSTERSLWAEAVRQSPRKLRPLIQLSRFESTDRSLDLLIQAKALAPNDYNIAAELGLLWLKMGQPHNSLYEFGRALALHPQDPQAISNRGSVLLAMHQEAAARRDFEAALNKNPCLGAARINMQKMGLPVPPCATAEK